MMMQHKDLVDTVMESVSEKVEAALRETFSESITQTVAHLVQQIVAEQVTKSLAESDFYKKISGDMESGLRNIYQEIKTARGSSPSPQVQIETDTNPDELFNKASDQLDEVLVSTEQATEKIIAIVEQLQELQTSVASIVKGFESGGVTRADREKLKEINNTLGNDLSEIMVSLSFQDLTGQRIKIIIDSLRKIEEIVKEMIVSTGLMIRTRESTPELDFEAIEKEVKEKTTELHGPTKDASQNDVDDLLAQFGL
jgi:chemotaxis protein CheZ